MLTTIQDSVKLVLIFHNIKQLNEQLRKSAKQKIAENQQAIDKRLEKQRLEILRIFPKDKSFCLSAYEILFCYQLKVLI